MSNKNSVMGSIKFDDLFSLGWFKLLFLITRKKLDAFFDWLFMLSFLFYVITLNLLTFGLRKEKPEPEEIRNVPFYTAKVVLVWFLLLIIAVLIAGIVVIIMHIVKTL